MRDWKPEATVAAEAAKAAGAIMREFSAKGFGVKHKGATDLVTEADVACEKAIVAVIAARYPDHAVVAEEGGASGESPFKWIVDPIDGTTNFAHGFPMYCASVALMAENEIVAGAVYEPVRDELFLASLGGGATLNGDPIRVSDEEELIGGLLATGFPYKIAELTGRASNIPQFESFARKCQALRRPGAAALDLAYVAAGRLDGFWEYHLHPWDMAAGVLLITEAGGAVTLTDGSPFDPFRNEIVASNGRLHAQMVETLAGV
jgi:myo-inositol-1(or 4)-monophosphatase